MINIKESTTAKALGDRADKLGAVKSRAVDMVATSCNLLFAICTELQNEIIELKHKLGGEEDGDKEETTNSGN